MKILYLSGKRGKEISLLEELRSSQGIEFCHIQNRAMWTIRGFRTVGKIRPDVILLEVVSMPSLIALLVRAIYKIPVICRLKGDIWAELYDEIKSGIPFRKQIMRYVNNAAGIFLLGRADGILPISQYIERRIKVELNVCKPTRVVHIPYADRKNSEQAMEPVPVRGRFILTATNFNFWGKVQPLLDVVLAMAPCLEEEGLSWIILGDGFFWKRFKERIGDDRRAECIHLLGHRSTAVFYQKAFALVYISGMDGLPNVLLEAANKRLPILMNSDCPAREFIQDGVNGILIDRTDVTGIRDVLKKLMTDDEYIKVLGDNAYAHAQEQFSVEKVGRELGDALHALVPNQSKLEI